MRSMVLRAIVGVALVVIMVGCGGTPEPSVRVLFIGNSYTMENNLPQLFADLSGDGGRGAQVEMVAFGGATLAQHLGGKDAPSRIAAQPWDTVVIQEQSVIPAIPAQRVAQMYPAVRGLARLAHDAGARPVLLLTWGRRDGLPDAGFASFSTMQAQITQGYLGIADELGAAVAPAGEAWRRGRELQLDLGLWQADGSHPSLTGSYLTACVLYAAIYSESPVGLSAPRGVSRHDAALLQQLAADAVLENQARWHLEASPKR